MAEGSSMGWDVREKRRELWHKDSRLIVLRQLRDPSTALKGKGKERSGKNADLAAFAMFRFDWEECMDDGWEGDECEVLYWCAPPPTYTTPVP
jgi:hypothetical protein